MEPWEDTLSPYKQLCQNINAFYQAVAYRSYDAYDIMEYIVDLTCRVDKEQRQLYEVRNTLLWLKSKRDESDFICEITNNEIADLEAEESTLSYSVWYDRIQINKAKDFLRSITPEIMKDIKVENDG